MRRPPRQADRLLVGATVSVHLWFLCWCTDREAKVGLRSGRNAGGRPPRQASTKHHNLHFPNKITVSFDD
jgi:hypothetical protein